VKSSSFFGLLLPFLLTAPMHAQAASPVDTIYYHGNILTGEGLDTGSPKRVSAIAIAGGMIVAAGDDAQILASKGTATLIDLHGAFVLPGFNDAHAHMGDAGRIKLSVDLTGTRSLAEMQQRVKMAAKAAPPGSWLSGGGWDHTLWDAKVLPTKADLDKVTAGHPAVFDRVDGHIAIANSAALTAASIMRTTPDPQGGKIDHDAHGEPTGIVRETGVEIVAQHIPPPTAEERRRGLQLALADAASHGVTSVQDFSTFDDFHVYEALEQQNQLTVRVSEWLPFATPLDDLKKMRASHLADDRMLHTGMLKGFMDGSLGSRTAALKAPYADDPGNVGIPRYDAAKLNAMAVEREGAGFQMGFHAIGDRAARMALDAFAAAERHYDSHASTKTFDTVTGANGVSSHQGISHDFRYRIEHAQVVDHDDVARFNQLGVIASMQPCHLLTDMNWAEQRLGPERAKFSYAWKAFLDAGVLLAFGTDYPVEPITPFRGVYAAVTRANEAGTRTYYPEQKLTILQAIFAYTQGSAYAEFADSWKGKLSPGYVADFVVLDRDLTSVAPAEILKTQVLRTVVAGKTVYARDVSAK
jgi:predicted amidohydrolase YtcJ